MIDILKILEACPPSFLGDLQCHFALYYQVAAENDTREHVTPEKIETAWKPDLQFSFSGKVGIGSSTGKLSTKW